MNTMVKAASYDYNIHLLEDPVENTNEQKLIEDKYYSEMDCYGLLGSPTEPNDPAYWLQMALKIMRYIGIAALFGFSTVDFVKAIIGQDSDALQKAIKTTSKRFIYAILLFFVPVVVEFIMNLFGVYGTCAL